MSRRQGYRTHAAECLRLAEIVNSPEVRTILITMAHGWYRLAQDDMQGERSAASWHLRKAAADPAEPDLRTA
jgi:hypothetical protein